MNPNAPKILIISSDTGGGHRSAAAAIVAGIQSFVQGESYAIRTIRAIEESHHLAAKLVAIYNWLLRNKQHWMKYYYWLINRFRPDTREFFYKRTVGYVASQFDKWCPHVVVSVHPLTQHMFARVLKELGLAKRIPLVTVVTDPYYGFWKGWACDDVNLYLVATEEARQQLIDYGIAPERIFIEDESRDTLSNAAFVAERYLAALAPRRLLIVTSPFHMARSLATFALVLGPRWRLEPYPSARGVNEDAHAATEERYLDHTRARLEGISPGDVGRIAARARATMSANVSDV